MTCFRREQDNAQLENVVANDVLSLETARAVTCFRFRIYLLLPSYLCPLFISLLESCIFALAKKPNAEFNNLWRIGLTVCGPNFLKFWENIGGLCSFQRRFLVLCIICFMPKMLVIKSRSYRNRVKIGCYRASFLGERTPNFGRAFANLAHPYMRQILFKFRSVGDLRL